MSLAKHLEEAAGRYDIAASRIAELRTRPPSLESFAEWLETLTELSFASADIQRFDNESIHEKLHAIASRLKIEDVL